MKIFNSFSCPGVFHCRPTHEMERRWNMLTISSKNTEQYDELALIQYLLAHFVDPPSFSAP